MRVTARFTCPIILVLSCALPSASHAQSFQKVYPSSVTQSGRDVIQTADGGFLVAGMTRNQLPLDTDIYLVRTNSAGDTLWTRTLGGSQPDYPRCIIATTDGNYFITGFTASWGSGSRDVYLVKMTPAGTVLWTKTYGGPFSDTGKEIIHTSDGNYVIAGTSNYKVMLMKIDPSGNVLWNRTYATAQNMSGSSVKQCSDGGYIMTGTRMNPQNTGSYMYLVRTNPSGDTLWTRTYAGTLSEEGKFIVTNSDGTFTLCATDSTAATDWDVHAMKISATGSIIWNKRYGGNQKDICWMIQSTTDGGYIIAATSRSFGWINPRMWLVKINASGDTLWTRNFGSWWHNHDYACHQLPDGGYMAVGHQEDASTLTHILFVRLNANGTLDVPESNVDLAVNVFPNPSAGPLQVNSPGHMIRDVIVYDITGQCILREAVHSEVFEVDLAARPKGIYFLEMIAETNAASRQKVIIQ